MKDFKQRKIYGIVYLHIYVCHFTIYVVNLEVPPSPHEVFLFCNLLELLKKLFDFFLKKFY